MSGPPAVPSALAPELFVLLIFVLILARRTYAQIQGAPYSVGRLFGFAGFYVLLFAALAFGTLYAAVATWGSIAYGFLVVYVAVPAVAAILAAPYVRRIVRFEQRGSGSWYYRLSWHVPVLYLTLFVVRIGAEVAVFGLSAFLITFPPPTPSSVAALVILIGVDLLFGFSLGLLIGRGIGVYRARRDLPTAVAAVPEPSPPLPGA